MNIFNKNINIVVCTEENLLNIHEIYLEIEFDVSGNGGGILANDANVRLVNYGVISLFSSIKLETISGKTIKNIDHCHP